MAMGKVTMAIDCTKLLREQATVTLTMEEWAIVTGALAFIEGKTIDYVDRVKLVRVDVCEQIGFKAGMAYK